MDEDQVQKNVQFCLKSSSPCCKPALDSSEKSSVVYALHTDFSKANRTYKLDDFFTDTGLEGMIEAKENDFIDRGSHSLAGL